LARKLTDPIGNILHPASCIPHLSVLIRVIRGKKSPMKSLTRREFVNVSAKGAAALGAGARGSAHAAGMSKLPGVEFKYVCDVWEQRGAGAERFTNSDEANALPKPKYRKQYRIPDEV
jgi:hypothetical protein